MSSNTFEVNLRYTRSDINSLFRTALKYDVEKGGVYDVREGVVHFRKGSETVGSVYFNWDRDTINQIEVGPGYSLDDILKELGGLELKALGQKMHGK